MVPHSTLPDTLDIHFLGRPQKIATAVIRTSAGVLLVDPGPTTCLDRLEAELAARGIGGADVHAILLTHIHLDHAGATGTIVRRHPHVTVYVHERGAPHLVDPSKLLASARRIYGADMDRFWGEFAVVPAQNLRVARDRDTLDFGDTAVDVAQTPGHASHHLCFFDRQSGVVFAGDIGGIRVGSSPFVLPPTPPPDVDLTAWRASIRRLRAWEPSGVFVTHFGLHADATAHLDAIEGEVDAWDALTSDIMSGESADPAARQSRFIAAVHERVRVRVTSEQESAFPISLSLEDCWAGLTRYWEKRERTKPNS
jgi:glyoxylase-like metal-dependent hydrolase (beta-lactamase superfamily II)